MSGRRREISKRPREIQSSRQDMSQKATKKSKHHDSKAGIIQRLEDIIRLFAAPTNEDNRKMCASATHPSHHTSSAPRSVGPQERNERDRRPVKTTRINQRARVRRTTKSIQTWNGPAPPLFSKPCARWSRAARRRRTSASRRSARWRARGGP